VKVLIPEITNIVRGQGFNFPKVSIDICDTCLRSTHRQRRFKVLTFQCDQYFTVCHILEVAVSRNPVPFLAKDFGNISAALFPMFIDGSLDKVNIVLVNNSFSDSYG